MATEQKTLQGTSMVPSRTVNNLQQSADFFAALGFEVEERWEDKGVLRGLMLKAGGVSLGLSQDDGKKGLNRVKGVGVRLYIEAKDNIDAVAARAKAAGLKLQSEPHDTEWSTREFEVVEPSGFLLTIASPSKKP